MLKHNKRIIVNQNKRIILMNIPSEKLAAALEALHTLQSQGVVVIRSNSLSRLQRERLLKNGFIEEVMKGWYIPANPHALPGETTGWYASYWHFIAAYLNALKGEDWCLSPEQSLLLHADNWTVPKQLIVRSLKARNNKLDLPYHTSLLDIRGALPDAQDSIVKENLRLYTLPAALIACGPRFFLQCPTDARAVLLKIRDASEILEPLLAGGHTSVAGRLSGAFRNVNRNKIADEITNTMRLADYAVHESDPFETTMPTLQSSRTHLPLVNRIRIMWEQMREPIIKYFPKAPGIPQDKKLYLKQIKEQYVTDAYHSLSIEGYQVSLELIERVKSGKWAPDKNLSDGNHVNAMAARGYWQAFQSVHHSIQEILKGKNAGDIINQAHNDWYRALFSPSISAGILAPQDLAGYRNHPVYIRNSMHVPPRHDTIRDAMPAFFELLQSEEVASVRVVLGHFIFVYIHPYMDGNGRMGRFLMNAMLASGGYPWTIIPVEKRNAYMSSLEAASVNQDIIPFAKFLASLVKNEMR